MTLTRTRQKKRHGGERERRAYRAVVAKGALILVDLRVVRGHRKTGACGMRALHDMLLERVMRRE